MNYEAVIGLEVHLHLKTRTKAFCGCSTEFGKEPNSQVCPVCLGFPGVLPVFNQKALDFAIKVAVALNCRIQEFTKFDRKHYYYPDLPKNFQISQYDLPLSKNGFLEIESDGKAKRIGINRVHMEEDAGKLIHGDKSTLVDFNRAGVPLLEIVSEPEINSAQEAHEYLTLLKSILEYLEVSDCDMEKGSLRCDANISVRRSGTKELGTKAELKNMNSFKGVKDALTFEIERQTQVLKEGGKITQETRLWDAQAAQTIVMRTKEVAKDYRYFPEPDLAPFLIRQEKIDEIKNTIPELPVPKIKRFVREYRLKEYGARILAFSKRDAEFTEECFNLYPDPDKKVIANWLIGPMLSEANSRSCRLIDLKVSARSLIDLIGFVERQEISNLSAKAVLAEMINSVKSPAQIIGDKNLIQISDTDSLKDIIEEVIKENQKSAQDFRLGKENALMFLVGQAMKKTKGKANPKAVQEILKRRLLDA